MSSSKKKLSQKFVFWCHISEEANTAKITKKTSGDQEYEEQVKKIAEFDTLEDFWAIFQFLKKPDDCKQGIEYQLFKDSIKPVWEDENNKNGGRISIKLRKEYSSLAWEELVLAVIGGELPKEVKESINGIVISCKKDYNFNTLQLWLKTFGDENVNLIEKNIREVLQIPAEVVLEKKAFYNPQKDYNKEYKDYNYKRGNYNNYYKKNNNNDYKEHKKYNNYNNKNDYRKDNNNNYKEKEEDDNYNNYNVVEVEEKEVNSLPEEKAAKTAKEGQDVKMEEEPKEEKEEKVEKKVQNEENSTKIEKKKKKKKKE